MLILLDKTDDSAFFLHHIFGKCFFFSLSFFKAYYSNSFKKRRFHNSVSGFQVAGTSWPYSAETSGWRRFSGPPSGRVYIILSRFTPGCIQYFEQILYLVNIFLSGSLSKSTLFCLNSYPYPGPFYFKPINICTVLKFTGQFRYIDPRVCSAKGIWMGIFRRHFYSPYTAKFRWLWEVYRKIPVNRKL